MRWLTLVCAAACFAALFSLPQGYYLFVRILVSIGALVVMREAYETKKLFWIGAFATVLIVYNPFVLVFPYHHSFWMFAHVITVLLFLIKAISSFFDLLEANKNSHNIVLSKK